MTLSVQQACKKGLYVKHTIVLLAQHSSPPPSGYQTGQGVRSLSTTHACLVLAPTTTAPTGLYEGVPVSIVTTLMGMPNMDFVVREARAAVAGQIAIVRLGTCGALRPPARLGSFMVASPGAVCVR